MIYRLDKGKIWDATSKLAKLYSVTEYVTSSEKWQESKNEEFIMQGGQKQAQFKGDKMDSLLCFYSSA